MSSVETRTNDALWQVSEDFRAVVDQVSPEQMTLPTPCESWNVRELIGHVASGSQSAAAVAGGASRDEAIGLLNTDFLGSDPVSAIDKALALQHTALDHPDVGERICHHPAGDMPGSQVIGFRIVDLLAHQWDLAQAIGVETILDPDVVQQAWDSLSPMAPVIAQLGIFGAGPSGTVGDDAPLDVRLLDLMGRRP